jgi:hypothetical protein
MSTGTFLLQQQQQQQQKSTVNNKYLKQCDKLTITMSNHAHFACSSF